MRISIVVPAYNEEAFIGEVLDQIEALDLVDCEVIVVNDGSTDDTEAIVKERQSDRIRLVTKPNGGKGSALRRGFEEASGDVVVVQDADVELRPANIPNLVAPIEAGRADVVYGSRFLQPVAGMRRSSRLANWFLTTLTNLIYRTKLTDMETAHKAISRTFLAELPLESSRYDIEVELTAKLARSGARIVEVPSTYTPRTVQEGKKIGIKDGIEAIGRILRWARWHPTER
ncbi:MAG TPA: glycosyltransferase family 2 protein [Acidimicrobiales bacterium]